MIAYGVSAQDPVRIIEGNPRIQHKSRAPSPMATSRTLHLRQQFLDRFVGARSGLASPHWKNAIYRHEVGIDPHGQLKRGSPILRAHTLMLGFLAGLALVFLAFGWPGIFTATLGAGVGIVVAAYPIAIAMGFRTIQRDRESGLLEQLYLTRMDQRELFDGKYYGAMMPWIEARRYLTAVGALFAYSVFIVAPGPWWILGLSAWLMGLNHFGTSASLGTLAGLKKGCAGRNSDYSIWTDFGLNPYVCQLRTMFRREILLALFFFGLLGYAGGLFDGNFRPTFLFPAFVFSVLIPFFSAVRLSPRIAEEQTRVAAGFRRLFQFDNTPG